MFSHSSRQTIRGLGMPSYFVLRLYPGKKFVISSKPLVNRANLLQKCLTTVVDFYPSFNGTSPKSMRIGAPSSAIMTFLRHISVHIRGLRSCILTQVLSLGEHMGRFPFCWGRRSHLEDHGQRVPRHRQIQPRLPLARLVLSQADACTVVRTVITVAAICVALRMRK